MKVKDLETGMKFNCWWKDKDLWYTGFSYLHRWAGEEEILYRFEDVNDAPVDLTAEEIEDLEFTHIIEY